MIEPFLHNPNIVAISLATRADCLEDDKIDYLQSLSKHIDIWVELGLQSIHNHTAQRINRGHTYETFVDCVQKLQHTSLKVCVHLINSLPYETKEEMLISAQKVGELPIHAVKLHMLHLMQDTKMASQYAQNSFPILSKEEYIDVIISQLEVLPKEIIIQRLTGDGIQEKLILPDWTKKKVIVLNDIDKEMVKRNTWQGKKC